jgi:hypothetical protein
MKRSSIVSLVCIVCALILYLIMVLVVMHPRFHAFWRQHPVAWTSLLPAAKGRILQKWPAKAPPKLAFQHPFRVEATTRAQKYYPQIQQLWTACKNKRIPRTVDARVWFLLFDQSRLIGTLVSVPYEIDTPYDTALLCQWIDHLYIHPNYRRKRACTVLVDNAIRYHTVNGVAPIGIFLTEYPLPFAFASKIVRVTGKIRPMLLPDLKTDVQISHRRVHTLSDLPSKAFESSSVRIHGGATLEQTPSSRTWNKALKSSHGHVVLNFNQTDWIHLEEESTPKEVKLFVHGFSCDDPIAAAMYIHYYILQQYKSVDVLTLIVASPFDSFLHEVCKQWTVYDEQFLYFYNYRISARNVHVPYQWNIF